jgi:ribosomal protein S18 acetylase RimI-like enzyme
MLIVRLARPDDCALLGAIEEAADQRYAGTSDALFADATGVPTEVAEHYCADGRLLVAEVDGAVIGFVGWRPQDDPGVAGISQISVRPEHGGRGIGSALMSAAHEAIASRGFHRIVLATQADIPWNAPWYERLGYSVVPTDAWSPWMTAIAAQQEVDGISWSRRVWMEFEISPLEPGGREPITPP